ncbi:MAG TPA: hypothetical protein VLH08_09285 [Acidobacteriota bacterium]|nr:hypothetical protein [Acidobacteriota bacterium]
MFEQTISIIAAIMILAAYGGQQTGKLSSTGLPYLLMNLAGAIILGLIAWRARQLGLTIVEVSWAIISLVSLIRLLRRN